MSQPSDEALYEKTKEEVDQIYDKPSAYRSMAYTRFYLRAYREKYGNDKNAYKGRKDRGDLEKWRKEKWIDIRSFIETPKDPKACGNVEYDKDEYPLCMPIKKARGYSKTELVALLNRKAELGKTRLVKEPYLRDLGVSKQTGLRLRTKINEIKETKPVPVKEVKVQKIKEPKIQEIKETKIIQEPEPTPLEKPTTEKPVVEKPIKEPKPRKPQTEQPYYKLYLEKRKAERARYRERNKIERDIRKQEREERAKAKQPVVSFQRFLPDEGRIISFD